MSSNMLGSSWLEPVALEVVDGLSRGMEVVDTGRSQIQVPKLLITASTSSSSSLIA